MGFADGQGWIDAREQQSPRPPVEWGEPDVATNPSVRMESECGCVVWQGEMSPVHGVHCEAHTFADLIEGERLLRLAQQEEPEGRNET